MRGMLGKKMSHNAWFVSRKKKCSKMFMKVQVVEKFIPGKVLVGISFFPFFLLFLPFLLPFLLFFLSPRAFFPLSSRPLSSRFYLLMNTFSFHGWWNQIVGEQSLNLPREALVDKPQDFLWCIGFVEASQEVKGWCGYVKPKEPSEPAFKVLGSRFNSYPSTTTFMTS